MAFTTAFDVSLDQPEKRFLIMAGFISTAKDWSDFDLAWRERLRRDKIPFFHMKCFAHSVEMFDGWKGQEDRRRSLLSDLLDLISQHAFRKFGVIVQSQSAPPLSRLFNADIPPIAIAGRLIAIEVARWQQREKISKNPEHIFEDGDDGKGQLAEAVKSISGVEPIFRRKKDVPEKGITGFTPLQAADILAYEVQKIVAEAAISDGRIPIPDRLVMRFPYQQLQSIPGEINLWNMKSSTFIEEMAQADRYFLDNPLQG